MAIAVGLAAFFGYTNLSEVAATTKDEAATKATQAAKAELPIVVKALTPELLGSELRELRADSQQTKDLMQLALVALQLETEDAFDHSTQDHAMTLLRKFKPRTDTELHPLVMRSLEWVIQSFTKTRITSDIDEIDQMFRPHLLRNRSIRQRLAFHYTRLLCLPVPPGKQALSASRDYINSIRSQTGLFTVLSLVRAMRLEHKDQVRVLCATISGFNKQEERQFVAALADMWVHAIRPVDDRTKATGLVVKRLAKEHEKELGPRLVLAKQFASAAITSEEK